MKVTLIAEVASNHGGNLNRAYDFIRQFAEAGADILKFQLTRVAHLSKADPQYSWFQTAELSSDMVRTIRDMCHGERVESLFTVYNPLDVHEVVGHAAVKIGSGEAHQGNLAHAIYQAKIPTVYVSEGLRPVHKLYEQRHATILACATRYPCPQGVAALKLATGRFQGWSDHCIGINECQLAILMGATVIEKHVCVKTQARPIQPWEATVEDFKRLRDWADASPDRFLGRWSCA